MGSLSIWHWLVVVVVVLLLFGRGKISELMGDMAQGIKAFKKGMSEDDVKAETKPDQMKTIDNAGGMKTRAETEKKVEGSV
ncbi:twin-arginine translocase TatA/TatE family subunit [Pseudorhodoplanes sinuspersici]|uniref:Sec-independent protein translocase protein TatA n=1 Tax=Pseudorhodoplanes sinuspersici TaxID=1235591 RepID=A0A1W6ZYI6_9HYPH|nr:twin-arginine translocase TatA/TatE family subunit [Pseudorhodoplanes sinuspersici]ARQ01795.1 twin-arginine translocase TatA/TatE family subunit [Pseudorhodoplanes sinuspersici]RKE73548.1 sec-independent protein translocase protein TatA [Pseudorhodoplanes sinuspersici]